MICEFYFRTSFMQRRLNGNGVLPAVPSDWCHVASFRFPIASQFSIINNYFAWELLRWISLRVIYSLVKLFYSNFLDRNSQEEFAWNLPSATNFSFTSFIKSTSFNKILISASIERRPEEIFHRKNCFPRIKNRNFPLFSRWGHSPWFFLNHTKDSRIERSQPRSESELRAIE